MVYFEEFHSYFLENNAHSLISEHIVTSFILFDILHHAAVTLKFYYVGGAG